MSAARKPSIEPRGLRHDTAALYVGVSPSKFDEMVKDGRMPKPKRVDGCVDLGSRALDVAFDELPSEGQVLGWTKRAG
jgi:predicted DNA-binding transcriptional regulator AlpA